MIKKTSIAVTKEDIKKRHDAIRQIQMEYTNKKAKLTHLKLLTELEKMGFTPSIATLNRDLVEVSKGCRFVTDIAEATYSKHFEDMYRSLDILEDQYWKWLDNPPKILKQKREHVTNAEGKQVSKIIESNIETISPVIIANNIREVVKAKQGLFEGDVLNVSIAMIGSKLQRMREEMAEIKTTQIIPSLGSPVKKKLEIQES